MQFGSIYTVSLSEQRVTSCTTRRAFHVRRSLLIFETTTSCNFGSLLRDVVWKRTGLGSSLGRTFNLLKSGVRSYFSVEERICERSLRQYIFPGDMKI